MCQKSCKSIRTRKSDEPKNVVIFEDDFVFTLNKNEVNNKIDNFFKDFNNRWDIVQLTTVHNNLEKCQRKTMLKRLIVPLLLPDI